MPRSYKLEAIAETRSRVSSLVRGSTWRTLAWLLAFGAVLGGVFGAALLAFDGAGGMLIGLGVGAVVGGLLGLVEGLFVVVQLASTLTRSPFADPLTYYSLTRRAGIVAVLEAYALVSVAGGGFFGELSFASWWLAWLATTVLPLLVNMAAIWWIGRRTADWMYSRVMGEAEEELAPATRLPASRTASTRPESRRAYRSTRKR